MDIYKGTLEFEYYGEVKRIPYNMTNLGGSPHIYIIDKYGRHHSFFYRRTTGEWLYGCTRGPGWRPDFMAVLHWCFDQERERHSL